MNKKRLISFIGLTLISLFSGFVSLILFPQSLFADAYSYDNCNIYFDQDFNNSLLNHKIDVAHDLIRKSDIYNAEFEFDIFIAENNIYNKIDDKCFGNWAVARAIDNNVIIKNKIDWHKGLLENGDNSFSLEYVLAHEMTHCLQGHHLGKLKMNPLNHPPLWKMEGHAEYISRAHERESPEYSFGSDLNKFLKLSQHAHSSHDILQISDHESTPYIYYKGKLMVQYLKECKGLSFDEIFKHEMVEDEVFEEILENYNL